MPSTLSTLLNARLNRYAVTVGAVAAATPVQAAPITVILPTPVNLASTSFIQFDVNQDGFFDVNYTGGALSAFLPTPGRTAFFGATGTATARQLTLGALIDISGTGSSWVTGAVLSFNTAVSPTFLAIRFASTASGPQRIGFAQISGSTLYGFAWDQANTITTFDITAPTGVPEPATGALTALALGAVAIAARKRKQA